MAFRGEQGNVLFDKNSDDTLTEVGAVRSWSLDIVRDSLDITKHGDDFRDVAGGLISGSGTIEMFYEGTAAGAGKGDLAREILATGTGLANTARAELYTFDVDGSQGATSKKITFNCLITNTSYGATVGEVQLVTIGFETKSTIAIETVS